MNQEIGRLKARAVAVNVTMPFLVQTSNAAITTIVVIVIAMRDCTQTDVSLVAGCYSLGFVIGCFIVPLQAVRVGLIRAYTARWQS